MNDLISRQAAIDCLGFTWPEDAIRNLPPAQPEPTDRTYKRGYADGYHKAGLESAEIVRCKDCKKWKQHYTDGARFRCDLTDSDDFCSWAERREG